MRIALKKMNNRQKLMLFAGVVVTFPISVPLATFLVWRRKRKKNRAWPVNRGPVVDLRSKLWQGFGNTTSNAIITYLSEGRYSKKHRAELAYEVARWQAAQENWPFAADLLNQAEILDVTIFRRAKPTLLRLEIQMHLGQLGNGQETLSRARYLLNKTEYAFAKANFLQLQNGQSADSARLELLNNVYVEAKLCPLALINPYGRLDIDNLTVKHCVPVTTSEKVTVIVPVFNAAKHLDTALRSICQQSYRNLEIIVIDDTSSDNSYEIIQHYAAIDARIIALRNEVNAGAYRTRNRGLREATGHYITVHDSDDWSHPQLIEKQVAEFAQKNVRGVFGTALRVSTGLRVELDPKRSAIEMMRRCYPAFMAKRVDFLSLGAWDEVRVGADDEMVSRFSAAYGHGNIRDLPFNVALTMQRLHNKSLTQDGETSINSDSFGMRKLYKQQHAHWREQQVKTGASLKVVRKSNKDPFPIPNTMWRSTTGIKQKYDIIIISDLALLGGTRRCNEGYVCGARADGLKVGLFHYPRWGFEMKPIASSYFDLCNQEDVDLLSKEDIVSAGLVLLHHPPILQYFIDEVPKIDCDNIAVLVNQSPMNLKSEKPWIYDPTTTKKVCNHFFGKDPIWIPISDRVRKTLGSIEGYWPLLEKNWYPPFLGEICESKKIPAGSKNIRIGRHSRDHWTKWPATLAETKSAYCANVRNIETHILGGIKSQPRFIENKPRNWRVFEFDTVSVNDFVDGLDIFVNFMHYDYIEEFGRNTMEAMARGKPVILERGLADFFGDAAIYCDPSDVEKNIRNLISKPDLYHSQVAKGLEFVREHCSQNTIRNNLRMLRT